MSGYSGTPLARKLGIGPESKVCVLGGPAGYTRLFEPELDVARLVPRIDRETDLVHIFITRRSGLRARLENALARMREDCPIWISWPKKAAKVPTDITEDGVREIALPLGLVDVKVCAVDEVWSGLKLVIRRERRASARR